MKLECDHVSQVTSTSTSMASGRESNWQRRCCPQAPSDHGLILIMTIINPMQLQGRSDEAAESSGFPHRKLTGSPARPPARPPAPPFPLFLRGIPTDNDVVSQQIASGHFSFSLFIFSFLPLICLPSGCTSSSSSSLSPPIVPWPLLPQQLP